MQAEAVLGQRYRLESRAGAGGMGTVYRATDLSNGRVCALKVLAEGAPAHVVERFAAEATILAKVSHPAVVAYLDHGVDPPFLVMEWVDGESLADRLLRGGATPEQALRLAERLARALASVHAAGVVHRDVKPRNVMLPSGAFEDAKLVDFGVARVQTEPSSTVTGVRLGTPRYMAPEQIVSARRVDGRADVFSLGCIVFEMLTGRKAFRGRDEVAMLARMVIEDAPRVRSLRGDLPPELDALVARLLARDPKRRPAATEALAREIADLAAGLRGMNAASAPLEEAEATVEDTTGEVSRLAGLTPLPPPSELPWPTLGRDAERTDLSRALAPGAVVGLWGALGVGKSHLAQAVARAAWPARGAIVCDLRGAITEADAVRRLAGELELLHAASLEDVCAAVAGRGGPLVVLDAADGHAEIAKAIATQVVAHAESASVLVVSRERPALAIAIELGALDAVAAGELFVSRSRGAASRDRHGPAIDAIARGLHGNALALTLAAARASSVGVEAVAARLERPLATLGSARTEGYPFSFREAIEGVWDALAERERWTALACAVFPGAMRPDMAAAVVAAMTREEDALDGLDALRARSLLRPGARETLVLDPLFRDLAREKLAAARGPDAERAARGRRAFAREAIARAPTALADLLAFEPNVLVAFDIACADGDAATALAAALAVEPALVARGPLGDLAALLERAIALPQPPSRMLAQAHAAHGRAAALGRDLDAARRSFDAAIDSARRATDAELEASTWLDVGVMHQASGDFAEAERCYAKVLDLEASAASRSEARAQGNLGALAHDRGDLDAAYGRYVRAIAIAESIGDARLLGVFLSNLAVLDREHGRLRVARQRFMRALGALEEARERRLVGITLGNVGMLELQQGRVAAARAAFERSAETLAAIGDAYSEALAQARLGAALAMCDEIPSSEAAIARAERLSARDDRTLAIVRFFRAFPERARAARGGESSHVLRERADARIASAEPLAARSDDVRAALRVLERWPSPER